MGAKTSTGGCFVLPTVTACADISSDLAGVKAAPRCGRERAPRAVGTTWQRLRELSHLAPLRAAAIRLHPSMSSSFARSALREVDAAGSCQGGRDSP